MKSIWSIFPIEVDKMSVYIGIDLGTTNLKVCLINLNNRSIDTEFVSIPVKYPHPGWVEQNPEDWIKGLIGCTRKLIARNPEKRFEVRAIGVAGQMHGLIPIDFSGNVVRPAIIWSDYRTLSECRQIKETIDVLSLTGNIANTSFTLPKILWLKQNEPDNYRDMEVFLLPKDYLRFRMGGGVLATDYTDASATLLMDIRKEIWSVEIQQAFGLKPDFFPEIRKSTAIIDVLNKEMAGKMGLAPGIPLVTGAGDQVAASLGIGLLDSSEIFLSCSTAGQILKPINTPLIAKDGKLNLLCHIPDGMWHHMAAIQNAGNVLEWVLRLTKRSFSQLEELVKTIPPGSEGLVFLPYLTGERTPVMNGAARGSWMSLSLQHDDRHLIRSVLEGVACSLHHALSCLEEVSGESERIFFIGGATKSEEWSQIIADVTGKSLHRFVYYEGSAYGAALIGALGVEDITIEQIPSLRPPVKDIVHPVKERNELYSELFNRYKILIGLESDFRSSIDCPE